MMMVGIVVEGVVARHRDAYAPDAGPRSVSWSKMIVVTVGLHSMI